ncbi:MAG: hypothetical protein KDE19_05655, partial [Caldilineaceae bacterium]|nr:hypothetical protein [Caldilineaceae bacterium]
RTRQTSGGWQERSADLSAYRGRTVSLYMNVYNDGSGGRTWMYVDSVSLSSCASPPIVQASVPTASTSGPVYPKCAENPVASTAPNTPIRIVAIDKEAESVTLQNVSVSFPVDVTGWHMCSITGDQEHDGIAGIIAPGAMASFNYSGSGSIWSNSEQDDGALYDVDGNLISYWID